jgi:hypothetical protein
VGLPASRGPSGEGRAVTALLWLGSAGRRPEPVGVAALARQRGHALLGDPALLGGCHPPSRGPPVHPSLCSQRRALLVTCGAGRQPGASAHPSAAPPCWSV